jgi:hypothetical protein
MLISEETAYPGHMALMRMPSLAYALASYYRQLVVNIHHTNGYHLGYPHDGLLVSYPELGCKANAPCFEAT